MVQSRATMLDNDTRMMGDQFRFQTTQWNLVQASRDLKSLNDLIAIYWKPLYFFVRQHGYGNETAKDIVQDFLTTLLERDALSKADPARGRFRTFLLASLSNFLLDWAKAGSRQKRGAGQKLLSLDFERGEKDYSLQVPEGDAPEQALNRAWAHSLWERSLSELKAEPAHLEAFRLYLEDQSYNVICGRTGLSEAAAKTAIHRLKAQVRDIVVGHIRQTVSSEADLQAELAEFLDLMR